MKCAMRQVGKAGKRRKHQCSRCGRLLTSPYPADQVNAPCHAWPRWWELGYIVEFGLAVLGVNQQRWNWLRFKLGFTTTCKCGEKIETLNASGGWLRDRLDVFSAVWRRLRGAK